RKDKLTDIIDKSSLDQNCSVIVNMARKSDKVSMTILVPPPMLSDNYKDNFLKTVALDFSIKPGYDEEKLKQLRQKAEKNIEKDNSCEYMEYFTLGDNKELNLLIVNGTHAFQNKIWGDALFYLERALNILQKDLETEKIGKYE